jgi:hypothetical protein
MAKRKLFRPLLHLSKRSQFVITTLFLTFFLLFIFLFGPNFKEQSIITIILGIVSIVVITSLSTLLCLRENLTRGNWIIIILLPVLFTLSCGLFYFILPARWLTRFIILLVFAIGFYAILLAENIYVVSSLRSIKLLHAARTIGFLLSVVTSFGLYYVLFSLQTYMPIIIVSIFVITFLLVLPIIWSVTLKESLRKEDIIHSFVLTLVLTEIGTFINFWPVFSSSVSFVIAMSFLSGSFYTLVGLSQHWLENKLFKQAMWEYLWVIVILFFVLFFLARWNG